MTFFIEAVDVLFQVYTLMLFARILASWVPQLYEYKAMQFIAFYTDPYLNFFRRVIPPLGMIDFSPVVAFFCLRFIQTGVIYLIVGLFA